MSNDVPFQPPRKKVNVLWWIGGAFFLLLALFFVQLFGPDRQIVISRQTTYATEPLRPNGLPDYEQYLLKLYREGVAPENNAATLLLPALWPGDYKPDQYEVIAKELGLDEIPTEADALDRPYSNKNRLRVAEWLRRNTKSSAPDGKIGSETIDDAEQPAEDISDPWIGEAMSRPWTSVQIPPLAQWVEENRGPLDKLVEGSRRPRCHMPSPSLLNGQSDSLYTMSLLGIQSLRDAARALSVRAMWHLGEGRTADAWQDTLAIHRIARLTTQHKSLVEQLVGIAIDSIACDKTVTLLHHGNLTVEQARAIQRDLATLGELSGMADSIDKMERAGFLDIALRVASGEELPSDIGAEGLNMLNAVSIDWNIILRTGNKYYDQCAAAARLPTYQERRAAFSQFEADIRRLESNVRSPQSFVAAAFSPTARSEVIAAMFTSLMLPAVSAATNAQDRGNTMLQLTRLAAALAVYRAEHGTYPEKLDALVPAVVGKLPLDLYNDKPFVYRRDGGGYLLYSTGENGKDEGGSNDRLSIFEGRSLDEMSPAEVEKLQVKVMHADDYSIRVPRPAYKMPPVESP